MKKFPLLFIVIMLVFSFLSCDLSPKYISEAELEEYKNKFIQRGYTNYSFDCSLDYWQPDTYMAHIKVKDGKTTKTFHYIHGSKVNEENCDEKIAELKTFKNYETSYEKIFIEDVNTIEDVYELIATIYQREKYEYEQDQMHHHLDSEVKYDKENFIPLYFHCNNSPRPLLPVTGMYGTSVYVENFKVDI